MKLHKRQTSDLWVVESRNVFCGPHGTIRVQTLCLREGKIFDGSWTFNRKREFVNHWKRDTFRSYRKLTEYGLYTFPGYVIIGMGDEVS